MMRTSILIVIAGFAAGVALADDPVMPATLDKQQQSVLAKFVREHSTPDRYVPSDAKFVDVRPPEKDESITGTKEKPIRQYTCQITPHRPVPGEERVTRADVYFYRPNPEKGRHGLTVKYTVDLNTGKQIGATEVLTQAHTPVSREELSEAVAEAKEQSEPLKALLAGRREKDVTYEYLQMKINKKSDAFEPGDRVVRFVFTAAVREGEEPPKPVQVIVNLTKGTVIDDKR